MTRAGFTIRNNETVREAWAQVVRSFILFLGHNLYTLRPFWSGHLLLGRQIANIPK